MSLIHLQGKIGRKKGRRNGRRNDWREDLLTGGASSAVALAICGAEPKHVEKLPCNDTTIYPPLHRSGAALLVSFLRQHPLNPQHPRAPASECLDCEWNVFTLWVLELRCHSSPLPKTCNSASDVSGPDRKGIEEPRVNTLILCQAGTFAHTV